MSWRVAKALLHLREQVNAAAPNRAKGSDGTIGDAAHASRSSDHNPWVEDKHGQSIVTAMDITHDPRHGVDCGKIVNAIIASRDKRVKYIIWNRRIASPSIEPRWGWRPYSGSNPHDHHFHLSVQPADSLFDDETDWKFGDFKPDDKADEAEKKPVLRRGDSGEHVAYAQKALGIKPDGVFGPGTQHSVIEFQKAHSLVADGVIGPATWDELLKG